MDYKMGWCIVVCRAWHLPSSAPLERNRNKSAAVSNDLPRLKFRAATGGGAAASTSTAFRKDYLI